MTGFHPPLPLVSVTRLSKSYAQRTGLLQRRRTVTAVDDISFDIFKGETLGLVGESGSGKSTTSRMIMQLETPSAGDVWFDQIRTGVLSRREMKTVRRRMQMIFQDPYSALNPRLSVGEFVAEPLIVHRLESGREAIGERVAELFRLVGLNPAFTRRYPHEFSGGQRQRINIARAIAMKPDFIVADEPITALDVSIQAQIINLLKDLQATFGITYLFVAHDLGMVRHMCDRVAVMLKGRIVEIATTDELFGNAMHPYTRALLSAMPVPDPVRERQRRRVPFDVRGHTFPPEAELRETSPGHFVLS